MFNKAFFSVFVSAFLLLSSAVNSEILSLEAADSASIDTLQSEVSLFKNIRDGINLSLALCSGDASCQPSASGGEVEQIIQALDQRIDGLTQRQISGGEGAAGLEDILVAYLDEREGFAGVLEQIGGESASVAREDIDESELFGDEAEEVMETTEAAEGAEQFNDMFADEDEDL